MVTESQCLQQSGLGATVPQYQPLKNYSWLDSPFFPTYHRLYETATQPLLLLWRNSAAVVIGVNQNPFYECNLQLMRQRQVTYQDSDMLA